MAAMTRLVSEARRHSLSLASTQPLLRLRIILFSSESESQSQPNPFSPEQDPQTQPNPFSPEQYPQPQPWPRLSNFNPNPNPNPNPIIQPVAYAAKPQPEPDSSGEAPRAARVAPLPEDRPFSAAGAGDGERRPVEALRRERTRYAWRKTEEQSEEEKAAEASPFPALLRPPRKETRTVLDLVEAIRQVKAGAKCSFDETVEAHVKLGIDAKRAGKGVRGSMSLPHGSGKVVRVAYFAEGKHADEARAAGADIVGGAELIEEIASTKKLNFDKCFATNEMILRMGKISRVLRERGLWPDRKLGTVTNDVSEAVNKVRQGHVEFKMDKTAIVHAGIGKVSYSEDYIRENIGAFVNALLLAKPAGLKKTSKYAGYINSFHICSTMGPGFPVSIQSVSKAADHYNKLQLK